MAFHTCAHDRDLYHTIIVYDAVSSDGIHIGIQNGNSVFQTALRNGKADILGAVAADGLENDVYVDVL